MIVWHYFSAHRLGSSKFIEGKMDHKCIQILRVNLQVGTEKIKIRNTFWFYQDNDPSAKPGK